MLRMQSIALLVAATLAASGAGAAPLDEVDARAEPGEAMTEPHDGAHLDEGARPYAERRYDRRRRRSHDAAGAPYIPPYGAPGGYAAGGMPYVGEWNYGQPPLPHAPPPPSPRGVHDGLYYY